MQVLYLMDKFSISDEAYHEISMTFGSLPRSYKVKKARRELNMTFEESLQRVSPPFHGVYQSLRSTLAQEIKHAVGLTLLFPISNYYCGYLLQGWYHAWEGILSTTILELDSYCDLP